MKQEAWLNQTHVGDCRQVLRKMIRDGVKVQTVVTSPPYWNLRDYGVKRQIGLEKSLHLWVKAIVGVFDLVWEVLEDDGTVWLNLGDSYAQQGGPGWQGKHGSRSNRRFTLQRNAAMRKNARRPPSGLKPKDLMMQPARVALALQEAGWYLRRDIIWHKKNPMPESAKDRPTTAHEYIYLLSKSGKPLIWQARDTKEWSKKPNRKERVPDPEDPEKTIARWRGFDYYYDHDAIAEPVTGNAHPRGDGVNPKATPKVAGWADGDTKHSAKDHARAKQGLMDSTKFGRGAGWRNKQNDSFSGAVTELVETRTVRSVWSMSSEPTSFAHFATFPSELPRRCILATTRPGQVVLDPFMGSGTVAEVATNLGRQYIGIELNPEYVKMQLEHRDMTIGMPL